MNQPRVQDPNGTPKNPKHESQLFSRNWFMFFRVWTALMMYISVCANAWYLHARYDNDLFAVCANQGTCSTSEVLNDVTDMNSYIEISKIVISIYGIHLIAYLLYLYDVTRTTKTWFGLLVTWLRRWNKWISVGVTFIIEVFFFIAAWSLWWVVDSKLSEIPVGTYNPNTFILTTNVNTVETVVMSPHYAKLLTWGAFSLVFALSLAISHMIIILAPFPRSTQYERASTSDDNDTYSLGRPAPQGRDLEPPQQVSIQMPQSQTSSQRRIEMQPQSFTHIVTNGRDG